MTAKKQFQPRGHERIEMPDVRKIENTLVCQMKLKEANIELDGCNERNAKQ